LNFYFKFAYIALCFALAIGTYKFSVNKKDWGWLVAGLFFTVIADYFLVLKNNHLYGVAVFGFAHVCYINRAVETRKAWFLFPTVFVFVVPALYFDSIIMLSGIYAFLFLANIFINILFFKNKKTCLPKINKTLILAGLVLFALCDVNVFLFNAPKYLGAPSWLTLALPLIWIFYLPSQILLAVSAFRYKVIQ